MKKIFGDKYDAFQAINSDEKNREKLRAEVLMTYAKKNGLAETLYQDYELTDATGQPFIIVGMNNPHAWFGERVSKPLFSFIVVLSYN